ncbi:heterokaryon incompatibility protein-domain-containing protein [Cercophora scortea]|uniref:Heterokaryon incompatibility protein-domain-containing protein n=1 Tax=Cercophora scortea TaxID=314031 RepID=A0AAE0J2E9_9PEZI|nr:heterokaryon incompatibility protein-domain-containing protein [Cercophora scortea]
MPSTKNYIRRLARGMNNLLRLRQPKANNMQHQEFEATPSTVPSSPPDPQDTPASPPTLAIFSYTLLKSHDSIRLLHLQPASEITAKISIRLSEHRLSDAEPYEALSYTWGALDDLQDITISQANAQYTLPVTLNCHSALQRLRLPDRERVMWIDAISINQADTTERSAQVALMGRIYSLASGVIIDVGEVSATSEAAIDFIIHGQTSDPDFLYASGFGLAIRNAVDAFYARPWFSRVWVLQEVFMAQRAQLLCGTRVEDWALFRPFRIWVDSRPARETEHWHVALPWQVPSVMSVSSRTGRHYRGGEDLLALLCQQRSCGASDPRDKVFALLSMVEFDGGGLVADYVKTATRAYTETAAWLLDRVGLGFLPCAGAGAGSGHEAVPSDLPSWVPNWNHRHLEPWMIGLSDIYYPLDACGQATGPVYELLSHGDGDSSMLKVRGLLADAIVMNSGTINIRNKDNSDLKAFVAECREYRRRLDAPVPLPKVRYWWPKTNEVRLHPPDWASSEYGLPVKEPRRLSDNDLCDYVTFFTVGRQLVMTEKGYFGVAPTVAQQGDIVTCFLGAKVPYVLRKKESNSDSRPEFSLIGESYIYGLMEGEAFRGVDLSNIHSEDPPSPCQDFVIS